MTGNKTVNILKANGKRELFDRAKLEGSLLRAGADNDLVAEITSHLEAELEDGMSTSQIYKHAFFLLDKKHKKVATRYVLRRAISELGPAGFAFEDFVASILREKGYKALTGQMVLGRCVEHEVDVVAWNENKLIMAEAKFHNEQGTKSDLKVALYVKARMDDLKENMFFYDKERKVDEGWLITNTKFTETAIHYGQCNNLIMIGWNYPEKGNLQDMIEDGDLHPITCLTSLSHGQKADLLNRGIVLCKTIKQDLSVLNSLGIGEKERRELIAEINSL